MTSTSGTASQKYALSQQQRWYDQVKVVRLVLLFTEPRTAFLARGVRRAWQDVLLQLTDDPAVWGHLISACIPSFRFTWRLMQRILPAYGKLRVFSISDLRVTNQIPNLVLADSSGIPLAWVTNVPMSTMGYDLCDLVYPFLPPGTTECPDLIAMGTKVEKTKRLQELSWTQRSGKKGWRLDLLVTIRGFLWQWDEDKDTVTIILARKKQQHAAVRPVAYPDALREARKEIERRKAKEIEDAMNQDLESIDVDV